MNWQAERVAVIGAGRSGRDVARALHQLGAWVELFDRATHLELQDLQALQIPVHLTCDMPHDTPTRGARWTRVVVSPGVRLEHPVFEWASRLGLPVWSEIELAYQIARAPIIAITGTNGKTTTTALIHHLLVEMGLEAHLCGNIAGSGRDKTLVQASLEATPSAYLVAEVSSFQLVHIDRFRPHIAVLTNIGEDHLDYHGSWEAYARAKANLFRNQTADDWAILNRRDEGTTKLLALIAKERDNLAQGAPQRLFFDSENPVITCEDGPIDLRKVAMPALPGLHGLQNALAAALTASILGATTAQIERGLATFQGVPHRMERVAVVGGVLYINNSMCTNAPALESSLSVCPQPCIVIAGGVDKNASALQLAQVLARYAYFVLLIGTDGPAIGQALDSLGYSAWQYSGTLERAVHQAHQIAKPGMTVVLAPGCASFDQFQSFQDRGERFRALVAQLGEGER